MKPELISGIIISLISIATLVFILLGIKKSTSLIPGIGKTRKNITLAVIVWASLISVLSLLGVFANEGLPPRPMIAMVTFLIILVSFSFSKAGSKILSNIPLHWLMFIQAFRILVELWFYYSYTQGVLPEIMTFNGENHDIYAGILAIIAGVLVMKKPNVAVPAGLIFNVAGFLLLVNTLRAAVTSFPSPLQQYPFDERLLQLGHFPFIFLPAILVPIALGFHIISIKKIFNGMNKGNGNTKTLKNTRTPNTEPEHSSI